MLLTNSTLSGVSPATVSWLEREARAQGDVLAARTDPGWERARAAARELARDDVDYLVIAARGTSDNAARYAQYLLGSEAQLVVALAAPWLYESRSPPRLARGAVLAISQSGQSPDVAAVLAAAREQRRPTIAITNDPSSPVAELADVVVPLLAGEERSVAATKTYLASLHAIAQIATCLHDDPAQQAWFARLPALVAAAADDVFTTRSRFDPLSRMTLLTAVGRGLQFPTAHETALKVREVSAIPAEAFSLPDLIHGPVAALGATGALWVISTAGREQPDEVALETVGQEVGVTLAVSDRDDLLDAADVGLRIPAGIPEWAAPMLAVIPAQAAALRLGELRGVDVDHPPGLHKVTLTR
jgi:glucosamine--fructose-6-phosphate aminotransferase (isomerizing)